jgi:hypothetical protein
MDMHAGTVVCCKQAATFIAAQRYKYTERQAGLNAPVVFRRHTACAPQPLRSPTLGHSEILKGHLVSTYGSPYRDHWPEIVLPI